MRRYLLLLTLVFALLLGCQQSPELLNEPEITPELLVEERAASEVASYWPTDGWRTAAPSELDLDADHLSAMVGSIEEQGLNVTSLLVEKRGYIVTEAYFNGRDEASQHEIFSITKSVVATLVGMAIDDGLVEGIDRSIAELVNVSDIPPQATEITLQDTLTMQMGVEWGEDNSAFGSLFRSGDWSQYMLTQPLYAEAGSDFLYCSGCSHLLSQSVAVGADESVLDYAQHELFSPLGISNYRWDENPAGEPIGGWGLHMTTRDLAKFGHLYLTNGFWEGQQLVPAEWIAESLTSHTPTHDVLDYGYQWWVDESWNAGIARGLGGQLIVVLPDEEIVVVITSDTVPNDRVLLDLIDEYIVN